MEFNLAFKGLNAQRDGSPQNFEIFPMLSLAVFQKAFFSFRSTVYNTVGIQLLAISYVLLYKCIY